MAVPFTFVPPLAVDRVIGVYSFEGGGFIALVTAGHIPTAELLDTVEDLIAIKRAEIARDKAKAEALTEKDRGHE